MEKKITAIICCILIVIIVLVMLFAQKVSFSEMENRQLSLFPSFSLKSFYNGQYFKDIDLYISDHFIVRDIFINLKTMSELAILKAENNNVFITNNQLFAKITEPDRKIVEDNINSIKNFSTKYGVNPYISVICSASEIQSDNLPIYAKSTLFDQESFLESIFTNLEDYAQNIDLNKTLKKYSNEEIFYRTDHHWTSKAAYLSYIETGNYFNYIGFDLDLFKISNVNDSFFGTLYSKSSYYNIKPDTIKLYTTDLFLNSFKMFSRFENGRVINYDTMFFEEYLLVKDKYLFFTGENQSVVRVKTNHLDEKKILIFKDSYANSFIPFLVPHFQEITMVDLRYVTNSYLDVVNISDYDYVYILYSFNTFTSSNDLLKIGG